MRVINIYKKYYFFIYSQYTFVQIRGIFIEIKFYKDEKDENIIVVMKDLFFFLLTDSYFLLDYVNNEGIINWYLSIFLSLPGQWN